MCGLNMSQDHSPEETSEEGAGVPVIQGVSTWIAGFLGATERGPETPRRIESMLEFERWHGGHVPEQSYLAYAVQGFFENGGIACYVGRVVSDSAVAAEGAMGKLHLTAIGRGEWGNRIMVKVDDASISPEGEEWFRMSILYYRDPPDPADFVDPTSGEPAGPESPNLRRGDVLEVYDNLTHEDGAENNAATVINASSRLVRARWSAAGAERVPNQDFGPLGENGDPGAGLNAADFAGDLDAIGDVPDGLLGRGRGLAALGAIDEISLLVAPDEVRREPKDLSQVTEEVIDQCERLKDRFGIISVIEGQSDVSQLPKHRNTSYAAIYYPWVRVFDPLTNDTRLVPATGHIAGILARLDLVEGVHKAPANEAVRGALALEFPVTDSMQGILNPAGVNAIREFAARGLVLWGARTMASDGQWRYVNVRRLFIYINESLDQGTEWVAFEPNEEPTWDKVRLSVTEFLADLWREGALMGSTREEAFFVKCDRTTMTQDDIDNGRLNCIVGVAPVRPAEFVIISINQTALVKPPDLSFLRKLLSWLSGWIKLR